MNSCKILLVNTGIRLYNCSVVSIDTSCKNQIWEYYEDTICIYVEQLNTVSFFVHEEKHLRKFCVIY